VLGSTSETGQRNDAEACQSSDFPKIENRVKEGDYKEMFHFISREYPDQQIVSEFQRSFQPVRYERFDAAVVVYKVRPSVPEGLPPPEPPDVLPPSLPATSRDKNDPVPGMDRVERRQWRVKRAE